MEQIYRMYGSQHKPDEVEGKDDDDVNDYNDSTSKFGFHKHWWSPELEDLKQKCVDVTDIWKSAGKPSSGDINAARLKCKYLYKHMPLKRQLN